jgi:hypothetical protein
MPHIHHFTMILKALNSSGTRTKSPETRAAIDASLSALFNEHGCTVDSITVTATEDALNRLFDVDNHYQATIEAHGDFITLLTALYKKMPTKNNGEEAREFEKGISN